MNQAVFQHFKDMHFSSAHACAEMTGINVDQVSASMREMISRGHLDEVAGCQGLFQYCAGTGNGYVVKKEVPEPQKKMWTAMCMPHNAPAPFTAFTIAQLSECSIAYAKRYIIALRLRGLITILGRSQNGTMWRVKSTAPKATDPPYANIQLGG